jgi:uncharacterized Fe-S cluster protein YjdI
MEPGRCIHAGVCVKTLPKVYNPKATPWITCDNASVQELKQQIDACPSGALTYRIDYIYQIHKSQMAPL